MTKRPSRRPVGMVQTLRRCLKTWRPTGGAQVASTIEMELEADRFPYDCVFHQSDTDVSCLAALTCRPKNQNRGGEA
jgi:hypothetical protein